MNKTKRYSRRKGILNLLGTLAFSVIITNNGFSQSLNESGIANLDQHQGYSLLLVADDDGQWLDTILDVPRFSTLEWLNPIGPNSGLITLSTKEGIKWEFMVDSTLFYPYDDDKGETQVGIIYYDLKVLKSSDIDWLDGFNILFMSKNKIEFFRLTRHINEDLGVFGNWDVNLPRIYWTGSYSKL